MADSDITIAGLTLTPGLGQTFAEWTFIDPNWNVASYLSMGAGELWAATANDQSDASFAKVAEASAMGVEAGIMRAIHEADDGLARWYWVRARTRTDPPLYGEFYPSGATAGVAAAATSGGNAVQGWIRLPSGVLLQWGEASSGIDGAGTATFPVSFSAGVRANLTVQNSDSTKLIVPSVVGDGISGFSFQINQLVSGSAIVSGVAGIKLRWTAIGTAP